LRGALTVFQAFRTRRGALTLAQLRSLHRLLVRGADTLYRLADRVERDARVRVHRNLLDDVADRVERFEPADDPVVAPVRAAVAELRKQLRAQIRARRRPTAREIRSAAIRLMTLADDVEDARDAPEAPHRSPRPSVGRPRNRILERILEFAARQHVPDAELAHALADVGFVPNGPGSAEVDLADRWAAIIKSARARRRRTAQAR
jgi:hypothetical protein